MPELDPPIKYRITRKQQIGPRGMWSIDRPDLGMVGAGYIFEVLFEQARKWRKANGWPIGLAFEDELEQALCRQTPDYCTTDDPREPVVPRMLNYGDVYRGTKTMIRFVAAGFPVVARDEAVRRAGICLSCPYNVEFTHPCGGGLCGELKAIVDSLVSPEPLPNEDRLHSCMICGCYLSASVWMDAQPQIDALSDHTKVQFLQVPNCWKADAIRAAQQAT